MNTTLEATQLRRAHGSTITHALHIGDDHTTEDADELARLMLTRHEPDGFTAYRLAFAAPGIDAYTDALSDRLVLLHDLEAVEDVFSGSSDLSGV